MIPINVPVIGEEEKREVLKVLESCLLTHKTGEGPYVKRFEAAFKSYVGCREAVALNSGTAALHSALLSLGVKPGDEVIVPSFTFTSTAEVVLLAGATPVFADIEGETYCVNPESIKRNLTKRTKAIIPVHLFGLPAEMDRIIEIARENDLKVISDSAQAHGAEYKGKKIGSMADISCFSFYATKNMTCGEGGMCTTNSEEIAEIIRMIRSHGEREAYETVTLGHNYRLSEVLAAIGYIQTLKLPSLLEKRRRNARVLTEELENVEGIKTPYVPNHCKHAFYLYTVRVRDRKTRDRLVAELKLKGVGASIYYEKPLHTLKFFRERCKLNHELVETEEASKTVLQLPIHPKVSDEQIKEIAEAVKSIMKSFKGFP